MEACSHEYFWYPSPAQEIGWKCVNCKLKPGEPPGYSPELDRSETYNKANCVLMDMVTAELVSVSNSDHGDAIASSVANRCNETKRYDQESIVLFIAELCAGDGKYWRELGERLVVGEDPRARCPCGALATIYSGNSRYCSSRCMNRNPELPF